MTDFEKTFEALTGHAPFPWQIRLHERFLADREDNIPRIANLPTGLGKTNVIAVWLLALMESPAKIPRRLVYVVNRRTVVDQTTTEIEALRNRLIEPNKYAANSNHVPILESLSERLRSQFNPASDTPLAISTLRGQFADNQEWSVDPSRPAVICGTVDMIGSRLLFEGYRIGFKSRPLQAGFLGQDSLLVHDEAHLESAFQKLIQEIEAEQKTERERGGNPPWPGIRVMALSATARNEVVKGETEGSKPFELTDDEKKPPDEIHEPPTEPIHHVWRRLKAKKSLHLYPLEDEKMLADQIAKLAVKDDSNKAAVVIFVRKVDDVTNVVKTMTDPKKGKVHPDQVKTLTGTMRGYERDQLVNHWILKCFLQEACPLRTVYLVCTSAGEVGVNLSADHMVCDLSTFDSMAQRFGRVNRFGDRKDTHIDVVHPKEFGDKGTSAELEERRKKTLDLLNQLNGDGSPKALGELPMDQRLAAFAPEPIILRATDILFDAWTMTTIKGKMPGRPPVAPYLHGIADNILQTTVAWRAELDLFDLNSPNAAKTLQHIFTKHRVRPHESLTTNSYRVADFLKKLKNRGDLHSIRIVLQFSRDLRLTTIGKILDDPGVLNAEPTLILPASFGGLDDKGTLSADTVPKKRPSQVDFNRTGVNEDTKEATVDSEFALTLDIADHQGYEPYENDRSRLRVVIVRTNEVWTVCDMPGGKPFPEEWKLGDSYLTSTALVNAIRVRSGLNVRLVQTIDTNDEGEAVRALVCLSPAPPSQQREEQPLADHVAKVEQEAKRIADALELPEPYRSSLLFSAKWHDEGKKAPIWQRYIGGPNGDGQPLGKSAKWRDPNLLAGYRHEFGSLLRIPHSEVQTYFADSKLKLTAQEQAQALDLALHMIAAHHGYGRPHFKNIIDHDFTSQQSEDAHIEVIHRYARLQRRYGRWGLAYLESLLRAADAAASRTIGLDYEVDDDEEEGES